MRFAAENRCNMITVSSPINTFRSHPDRSDRMDARTRRAAGDRDDRAGKPAGMRGPVLAVAALLAAAGLLAALGLLVPAALLAAAAVMVTGAAVTPAKPASPPAEPASPRPPVAWSPGSARAWAAPAAPARGSSAWRRGLAAGSADAIARPAPALAARDRILGPAETMACVDLAARLTWLQSAGTVTFGPVRMAPGPPGTPHVTPRGLFRVAWKAGPDYVNAGSGEPMPWAVFLAPGGIALHGGSLTAPSRGCVHLAVADARYYHAHLPIGAEVVVF